MPLSLYIETTIVSYLTARSSRDIVIRAHQRLTREWWRNRRGEFELYASPLVLQEARMGRRALAMRRVRALRGPIPERAEVDALHIATAAVHGIEYLLTWNCRHIANALMRGRIEVLCRSAGFEPPIMCTPEELAEE